MKFVFFTLSGITLYTFGIIDNYELIFWGLIGIVDVLESKMNK